MNKYEVYLFCDISARPILDRYSIGDIVTRAEALMIAEHLIFDPEVFEQPWVDYVNSHPGDTFRVLRDWSGVNPWVISEIGSNRIGVAK